MADNDPVARARAIAARLAATAIPSDTLGKRKSRWEDDEFAGPAGHVEKKRKKVYIPVDKYPDINFMGLLIGPRGSNQKRMEDESGAKILIRGKGSSKDPTGEPDEDEELHVLITAESDEAIAKAQSAVEDILFNPQQAMKLKQEQLRKVAELKGAADAQNGTPTGAGSSGHYGPPSDSQTFEMKVPRPLVGYIIGRGGETIRDLQMKSGARIQIVREEECTASEPDRFVSISGSEESISMARRMIQNLMDERASTNSRESRYSGPNPDGSEPLELSVPNERVGFIIGRGGATVKSIQQRTGTNILIPNHADPNSPNMRMITISGTMDAKLAAKQEIMSLLDESSSSERNISSIYMQVPQDRVGVVIGKRGETVRGIQDRHNVRVQIPQVADVGSNPPVRTISIQGPADSLHAAKEEIDLIILHGTGVGPGPGASYGNQQQQYGSYYGAGYSGYDQYGQQQQQQQQFGSYSQGQGQGQYDAYSGQYYQQQSAAGSEEAASDPTATTTAAAATTDPTETGGAADATRAATAAATTDPNDPNAYWNGYYEYAAYYGIDAANAAWGVTGAAAQEAAAAYQQYQQQQQLAGATDGSTGESTTAADQAEAASLSSAPETSSEVSSQVAAAPGSS